MDDLPRVLQALEDTLGAVGTHETLRDPTRVALRALTRDLHQMRVDPLAFTLARLQSLSPSQRRIVLRQFCRGCGGDAPCDCMQGKGGAKKKGSERPPFGGPLFLATCFGGS